MFKFSKIVVLFIMIVSLIACSSLPSGVSRSEFKNAENIVNLINYHYENELELNDEDSKYINDYLENLKHKTMNNESANFHAVVHKLYVSYDMFLGFETISNTIQESFVEEYVKYKEILINEYSISLKDMD